MQRNQPKSDLNDQEQGEIDPSKDKTGFVVPGIRRYVSNPRIDKIMASSGPNRSSLYQTGRFVDVLDSSQSWRVALILEVDAVKGIFIQYDGWAEKWNEWIPVKSYRVAPFRRHTRRYTAQDRTAIRTWTYDSGQIQSIRALLKSAKTCDFSSFDSADEITQFFTGKLFTVVDCLLAWTPETDNDGKNVVRFFEEILLFVVEWMKTLPSRYGAIYQSLGSPEAFLGSKEVAYASIWPELFLTVERILGTDQRLQAFFKSQEPIEVSNGGKINGFRGSLSKENPTLRHLINTFFFQLQGFDCVLQLLQNRGQALGRDPVPVTLIPYFPVWKSVPAFSEDLIMQQNYVSMANTVLQRISHFSETDIRYYDKDTVQNVQRVIYALARDTKRGGLVAQAEDAELSVAAQLIRSKLLDKRVKGINGLHEAILRASTTRPDRFLHYVGEKLATWLKKERIVDVIVGDRPHAEVLKRSVHVFSYLAEFGYLTEADIEALWTSTVDKHESYTRVVYELLAELADFLQSDLLGLVYRKLRSVNPYTDFLVQSMKQFTLNACSSYRRQNRQPDLFFLTDFLSVLTSPSVLSVYLVQSIAAAVADLFVFEIMRPFQGYIMKQLIADEAYNKAKVLPLSVALKLMQSCSGSQLEEMLIGYGQGLIRRTITWATDRANSDENQEDLKVILEFLGVVASKGVHVVQVRSQEMMSLWAAFTSADCSQPSSESFFSWLSTCVATESAFLGEVILQEIFKQFSRLSPDAVSRLHIEAFRCFQQLFFRTNYLHRYLEFKEDYVIIRLGGDLIGLDTLVTFVLYTESQLIKRSAVRLIGQLHLRLHASVSEYIVDNFISQRIAAIDGKSEASIEGNLSILVGLIEEYENLTVAKQMFHDMKEWETIYYRLGDDPTWKMLPLSRSAKMSALRKSIAYQNNLVPELIVLEHVAGSYTFLDDDRGIATLGHALIFTVKEGNETYRFLNIANLIGDSDVAVRRLFDLISEQEVKHREKTWFILSRLTESHGIREKIRRLDTEFDEMIDTGSIHKQLLAMKVMQELATEEEFAYRYMKERPNELLDTLICRFMSVNEDLVSEFAQYDSSLTSQYANVLLRLLNKFSVRPSSFSSYFSLTNISTCLCDLLFLYSQNATEALDMQTPVLPMCVYQLLLRLANGNEFLEVKQAMGSYRNLQQLIFSALCKSKQVYFSSNMKTFFLQLAESPFLIHEEIGRNVMSLLSAAVKESDTTEFFSLASKLIERNRAADFSSYFQVLFETLQNRPPEESFKAEDKGLTGALMVMRTLAKVNPALATWPVAEYVLLTCLIDFNETQATQSLRPKCKSPESRLFAFKLLNTLIRQDVSAQQNVLRELRAFYTNLAWRKPKLIHWLNSYTPQEKSSTGFVGLRNLGCTCYMNSMLQQLFLIDTFRLGLLQCELQEAAESVTYQLQKIAAGLSASDKMYIQARGLCEAYKNWDGQPLNPHEQMDVDEFFNGLMEKIEGGLKTTGCPKLVENHFRGILTTQCIGKGTCTHRSERDEPFLTLPIEIKNKSSILESLQALTTGEVLEGDNAYACDFCNQKVTARRCLCIRSLPNVLLLTLRRFDFDMDTMTRIKLNSFCEFPLQLDMEPYTLEGVTRRDVKDPDAEADPSAISPDYYAFSLRGVIIHMGSAEAGHYYSYILDRVSGLWIECNDTTVDRFDPANIQREAFGVSEKILEEASKEEIGRMKNAYVLVYERKNRYLVKGKDDSMPLPMTTLVEGNGLSVSARNLMTHYQISNQKYWKIKRVFSPEFSKFAHKLILYPTSESVKFCLGYFLTVQIRSKEPHLDFMRQLYENVPLYPELSWWLLEVIGFPPMLKELLITCPLLEMKKIIIGLIEKCAKAVSPDLQETFLNRLLAVLDKFHPKTTKEQSPYFELLHRLGLINTAAVLRTKVPLRLMLSLMGKINDLAPDSTLQIPDFAFEDIDLGRRDEIIEDKYPIPADTSPLCTNFQLALISHCFQDLSKDEIRLLQDPGLVTILVRGAQGRFAANQSAAIFSKFMVNTPPETDQIFQICIQALVSHLKANDSEQFRAPLLQLKRFIDIQDEFQGRRIDRILQELTQVILSNLLFIKATEVMVGFLYRLAQKHKPVRNWIVENSQNLSALYVWKQKYITWSMQTPNGLQINKAFSPVTQYTDFRPSTLISQKIVFLLGNKVPEKQSFCDSDEDLYDAELLPGSKAEYTPKDDTKYRVIIEHSFGPALYIRYVDYPTTSHFFVPSDDDKLMYPETRFFSG